jgi:hypothetical protein
MGEIKNFSKVRKVLQFQVDDDVFDAVSTIPAEVMIQFAEGFTTVDPTKMNPREMVSALRRVIEMVLMPDSLKVFQARMSDPANPIDMSQLDDIVTWLFEEYGLRPTVEPSSSSAGGSLPESGITSTESMPGVASISALSPSISS